MDFVLSPALADTVLQARARRALVLVLVAQVVMGLR